LIGFDSGKVKGPAKRPGSETLSGRMYQTKLAMSTGAHANRIPKVAKSRSSGPILTFAPRFGGIFANVRIVGPLANTGF
jgi:hypothetical protein